MHILEWLELWLLLFVNDATEKVVSTVGRIHLIVYSVAFLSF